MNAAITGIILAGGLARRMGGVDKGLQVFRGQPLAAHVAARLAPQVARLMINANRNQDAYAALGYPVFGDAIPDFAGPLAGLHAALAQAETPLVLTAPCDSPLLPADLAARLFAAMAARGAPLAFAVAGGRQHPVFCLCRRELRPALECYLLDGGRRVLEWCAGQGAVAVDFSDEAAAFGNFNTLADLAETPVITAT